MKNRSLFILLAVLAAVAILLAIWNMRTIDSQDVTSDSLRVDTPDPDADEPLKPLTLSAFNDDALFLAGLPVEKDADLKQLQQAPEYSSHMKFMDEIWGKLETDRYKTMRAWRDTALADIKGTETLFYPFSGPDFLHSQLFFPGAKTVVLTGLEPVGNMPDVNAVQPLEVTKNLQVLEKGLDDILNYSFFKTIDMAVDFKATQLNGTLPIILTFMARTGCQVIDIRHVGIRKNGELMDAQIEKNKIDSLIAGVEILWARPGDAEPRKCYYFSLHLEDGVFVKEQPHFKLFAEDLVKPVTYLKSASYLMHKPHFSNIRNLILGISTAILQDDSGIAYEFFDHKIWEISLYGNYTGPIGLFGNHYEKDLEKAFKEGHPGALPFGIGYKFKEGTSSLLLARRK